MAKAKNNYYAVLTGRKPGIYKTWSECQKQVTGFKGARFKGFVTLTEAEYFMSGDVGTSEPTDADLNQGTVIYVDGSYFNGRYSWGFAVYENGSLVDYANGVGKSSKVAGLRNVAGEMQAAMEAVLWAEANGVEPITICHDYEGIAAWPLKRWRAKLPETQEYTVFMMPRLGWVKFQKVAGHTGVEGNELADKLAKEALK